MIYDLPRMRRRVRKPLGIDEDDTDLSSDDIDELLNISFWEIQGKFPFREKEKTVTFVTVPGTRNYDLPRPYDAIQGVSINDAYTRRTKLEAMSPDEYERRYTDETADYNRGFPTHYVREGCMFRLYPTPNEGWTVTLRRLITLDDLADDNLTSGLPQEWNEIIVFGAIWRAFIDIGDFARANQVKSHQITLINSTVPTQSKEERDYSAAGIELIRRDY